MIASGLTAWQAIVSDDQSIVTLLRSWGRVSSTNIDWRRVLTVPPNSDLRVHSPPSRGHRYRRQLPLRRDIPHRLSRWAMRSGLTWMFTTLRPLDNVQCSSGSLLGFTARCSPSYSEVVLVSFGSACRSTKVSGLDSCQLPVASCQLPVASCQLPVASRQSPVVASGLRSGP
jgi:hypothetical protein